MITQSAIQAGILASGAFSSKISIGTTYIQNDLSNPAQIEVETLIYFDSNPGFSSEILESYLSLSFNCIVKIIDCSYTSTHNEKLNLKLKLIFYADLSYPTPNKTIVSPEIFKQLTKVLLEPPPDFIKNNPELFTEYYSNNPIDSKTATEALGIPVDLIIKTEPKEVLPEFLANRYRRKLKIDD